MTHKKKLIIFIIFSTLLAVLLYLTPRFIQKENGIAQAQAKELCHNYNFDKANPSVHKSFDQNYHEIQWQNYKQKFGSTEAATIDEFCAKINK